MGVFLLSVKKTKNTPVYFVADLQVQMPAVRCCVRKQVLSLAKICVNMLRLSVVFFFAVVCLFVASFLALQELAFFLLVLLVFLHRCFGPVFCFPTLLSPPSTYCLGNVHVIPYCFAGAIFFSAFVSFFYA